jgi:hypothetical protein
MGAAASRFGPNKDRGVAVNAQFLRGFDQLHFAFAGAMQDQ